jgi:trimeric autotransporter adhesin
MLRRLLLLLLTMSMFPTWAHAATFWTINASASPGALRTNLVPARPANFGNYTTPNGGAVTNITKSTVTSVVYGVSVPPGFSLNNVKIDNVQVGTTAGNYTVNKGTLLSHTISAAYTALSYVITTSPVSGGNISPSATYSISTAITLTPNNGNLVLGAIIDSVSYNLADPLPAFVTRTGNSAGAVYTFTTGNHTMKGIFGIQGTATAVITTPSQEIATNATGITVDGSASTSNISGTSYGWSATCGTITPTAPNSKIALYNAPATLGTCQVLLTVTAAGVSPSPTASVTFTVVSPVRQSTNSCLACHNGTDGPAVNFLGSPHYDVRSCADCHNPGNALSHAYHVNTTTVSTSTFKVMTSHWINGYSKGDVFCASATCHSSGQVVQSTAHATVNCGTCHHNDAHQPFVVGGAVNATYCATCHGVSAVPVPVLSAAHNTACSGCHGTVVHNPHIANAGVNANFCSSCHGVTALPVPPLSAAHSTICSSCHGTSEHNPHIASAGVNAGYCGSCHGVATNPIPTLSAAHSLACSGCHGVSEHNPHIASAGVNANYCGGCHGVSAAPIPPLSSAHSTQCSGCHGTSEHNPHTTDGIAANPCFNCHNKPNTAHYYVLASGQIEGICAGCHSGHNHNPVLKNGVVVEHFNGYTSYTNPNYAAAYVTPATLCSNCHKGGDPASSADLAIVQFRQEWAASPHGDVKGSPYLNTAAVNWKASGMAGVKVSQAYAPNDCQRCHTSGGYVLFSNVSSINPLASAAARYSEPITCNACHNPDFSTRTVSARTGYYNYSSALTGKLLVSAPFPSSSTSNICIGCHTGREAGDTIKAMATATAHKNYSSAFWQDVSFVSSHWLTAGGQVFGVTGYEYPGINYSNTVNHSQVGSGLKGPCVTCHMPNKSHTRNPWTSGYDQCVVCHGAGINATFVSDKTADFNAALKALGVALTQKGFTPNVVGGVLTIPYFTNRNWGNMDTGPANMGAAFNYNMLMHDPGAFAHNPTYSKRLVRDSIDYLTFGSVDRNRDLSATIVSLLSNTNDQAKANAFLDHSANGTAACYVCHSASIDPLNGRGIIAAYNTSMHANVPGGATCSNCHAPAQAVAHPPEMSMLRATADINPKCSVCHVNQHTWPSVGICTNCHNGHDPTPLLPPPHLGNFSSAQYKTVNISCENCHYASDNELVPTDLTFHIYSENRQWAKSGKANPKSPAYISADFKTLGSTTPAAATAAGNDCVKCHTTTGYINYVSSNFTDIHAWGLPGDRTREMIACSACHNPTPFVSYDQVDYLNDIFITPFTRRDVPLVTAYYNYSTPGAKRVSNPVAMPNDAGPSNNCVVCHSGKTAGSTLKALATPTNPLWGNTPFVDPHGMGAAGILYAKTGFEYTGRSYTAPVNFGHSGISAGDACIACHMSTSTSHSFSAISSASNGAITKITSFDAVCAGCHSGGPNNLTPEILTARKLGYRSSLKALSAALASKGIYFNPTLAPYFFSDPVLQNAATAYKTWDHFYVPASNPPRWAGRDLMGAAFNLRLLWSEAGGYTHNSYYARRLIYDSIDLVGNGKMVGGSTTVSAFIGGLPITSSYTADDIAKAQSYIGVRP